MLRAALVALSLSLPLVADAGTAIDATRAGTYAVPQSFTFGHGMTAILPCSGRFGLVFMKGKHPSLGVIRWTSCSPDPQGFGSGYPFGTLTDIVQVR